jgi:NAD(P)-dependent dehydrogenase (short-subunit alcohol dehydrogenase family)
MKVLVVGASRGIGAALVQQYLDEGATVLATARTPEALQRLAAAGAHTLRLDVADAAGSSGLAWACDGWAFDVVIVNAGVYGPERAAFDVPTEAEFDTVMRTNVLGAMRVLAQVEPALAPDARVMLVSSNMGSMGLRSHAARWLYRASKAALNSVAKDASLVLAGRAVCVAVHPGWVRTAIGGPEAPLSADDSAQALRRLIERLQPADNGGFFDPEGAPLPW